MENPPWEGLRRPLFPNQPVQTCFTRTSKKNGEKSNKVNARQFAFAKEVAFVGDEQRYAHGNNDRDRSQPCKQTENDKSSTKEFGKNNQRVGCRRANPKWVG